MSSADRAQLEAVYPHIRSEVDEAERAIRRPLGEARLEGAGGTITGFLMRSRVVSGWPNLHVRAYARDVVADDALTTAAESDPSRLKVLRMERLAPAVLLVLFDGVPAVVHVEEPRQGIQFGARHRPERAAGAAPRPGARAQPQHRRPDRRRQRAADRRQLGGRAVPAGRAGRDRPRHAAPAPRGEGAAGGAVAGAERIRAADAALPLPAGVRRPDDRRAASSSRLDTFKPTVSLASGKATVKTNLGL